MLTDVVQLSAQFNGLFHPVIGNMVKLWNFHANEFKPTLPDENQLAALVSAHAQMSDICFSNSHLLASGKGGRFGSYNVAVQLDLGWLCQGLCFGSCRDVAEAAMISTKSRTASRHKLVCNFY